MFKNLPKVILTILAILISSPITLLAQQLESDNYKIIDVDTNSGGQTTTSQTENYKLLNSIGTFSGDPRLFSNSYRAGLGAVEIFTANTPLISCFETDTNGSSDCTTGPSYLNTNGMVTVCGYTGCYKSARVEIDPQKNPADTLFAIQISRDEFATEIMYIDGTTREPKDGNNKTIADYLTKSTWEATNTNITGLEAGTQYWVRAVALHGDFTESQPGPSESATTANASISFDIDVADLSGVSAETTPPFQISFTNARRLIQTGPPKKAEDLIWLDAQTNGLGGFAILQRGRYGGLYSSNASYTLSSSDANLDSTTEGFGLQNFYIAQNYNTSGGNGSLSQIGVISNYDLGNNIVGEIATSFLKMYETDGPVMQGRIGINVLARASATTPAESDYVEDIIFVMVPKY